MTLARPSSFIPIGTFVMALGACSPIESDAATTTDEASMLESSACSADVSSLDGFDALPTDRYLDLPDIDTVSATLPVENELVSALSRESIPSPLTKRYCHIGIQSMTAEFEHPVEDDAVRSLTYRALYRWVADQTGDGWQLERIGVRQNCSRGRSEESRTCL